MEYKISKLIANKKKYIFHIIMAVFTLISLTIPVVGSFAMYQYEMTKRNFIDNRRVKNIEISTANVSGNRARNLNESDLTRVKQLLSDSKVTTHVFAEYFVNFGISAKNGQTYFIKAFSNDYFYQKMRLP
ncbi:MAG: hypothetical protein Q3960_02295 [Lactobacillus sp.]|nr:hypothetical protein [Lactobacillus sp.]